MINEEIQWTKSVLGLNGGHLTWHGIGATGGRGEMVARVDKVIEELQSLNTSWGGSAHEYLSSR